MSMASVDHRCKLVIYRLVHWRFTVNFEMRFRLSTNKPYLNVISLLERQTVWFIQVVMIRYCACVNCITRLWKYKIKVLINNFPKVFSYINIGNQLPNCESLTNVSIISYNVTMTLNF